MFFFIGFNDGFGEPLWSCFISSSWLRCFKLHRRLYRNLLRCCGWSCSFMRWSFSAWLGRSEPAKSTNQVASLESNCYYRVGTARTGRWWPCYLQLEASFPSRAALGLPLRSWRLFRANPQLETFLLLYWFRAASCCSFFSLASGSSSLRSAGYAARQRNIKLRRFHFLQRPHLQQVR